MVVVSILPHAIFGRHDHREDAPNFRHLRRMRVNAYFKNLTRSNKNFQYHTDYGKLPAYLTKRKKELDSEYDGGNEVSSTIPKPAQEPQSGTKEISKPGQKSRKEISPSPTGPATVQKSPGPKKERRKSMERRRSIERRRSMQKDLPRKSVHGQFKETHAPRSSITRTIERPEIDRKMENGPKRRSFENLKNQTRRDSFRDYETQRRDSIRTNETRNRTSTQEPPHERKSPTPPRDRKSEYDPRDDRDRGRPERRQSTRRNSKSRIPLATSRVKMLGDRRSSQEFHKYSNPTVHPSDTSSSQKRNLEYQDLVNSGILALPFINQYGMSNSPILPGLMPPPGVFAFQNYDPKGVMKAQSMFQAAQIQHIQASVAKAQFEANLVANKEEEKPVNQKSELQYQIKQGSSGTWIISQKKEQVP